MIAPARPDEGQERQKGEPPDPGVPDEEEEGLEVPGDGHFDLNNLEVGGEEDEDAEPRFLGDRALLYGHDAQGPPSSRRMMVFQGCVSGHRAVVLLDLGANANFVSQQWARSKGLLERQMKTATEVTTATGRTYSATTQVAGAEVHVVGRRHRSSLMVVPLSTYDVILGTPWFRATKPVFDWDLWTCNGHAVDPLGGRSVGHPGRTGRRLQSMAIGAAYQGVMRALLKEYHDVFATKLPPRVDRSGRSCTPSS